jgi:uncharacterized membrane protein YhaH (DUF805 family)
MNELSDSEKIKEVSDKVDSLILGYKSWGLSLLLLTSALNLLATFQISKFGQIYKDVLGPEHPLPFPAKFLLHFTSLVIGLAVLWPTLGIIAVLRFKSISYVTIILSCLLVIVVAQITLTWFGLFMPMQSTTNGMSDSP